MDIRPMEHQELEAIVQIYLDVMRATHKGVVSAPFLNSLSMENTLNRFRGILNEKAGFCYVAVNSTKIVGFAIGSFPNSPPEGYQGELNTLYVLPEFQQKGIGKDLFFAVVERFIKTRVSSIFLTVFKKNQSARDVYQRLGGRELKEHLATINGEKFKIIYYGWTNLKRKGSLEKCCEVR